MLMNMNDAQEIHAVQRLYKAAKFVKSTVKPSLLEERSSLIHEWGRYVSSRRQAILEGLMGIPLMLVDRKGFMECFVAYATAGRGTHGSESRDHHQDRGKYHRVRSVNQIKEVIRVHLRHLAQQAHLCYHRMGQILALPRCYSKIRAFKGCPRSRMGLRQLICSLCFSLTRPSRITMAHADFGRSTKRIGNITTAQITTPTNV